MLGLYPARRGMTVRFRLHQLKTEVFDTKPDISAEATPAK
jgi:hypothetical protein